MRKLQKEVLSKPTNQDFFNLFFKSQSVTYLIGIFGQIISGFTEFYFVFTATKGSLPIFQIANVPSLLLASLAVYIFEVIGVRVFLVKIIRQIVSKKFGDWTDWVLFAFNLLFCLALCGTNLWFSLLGQTASFHSSTNVRVTDQTFHLDSAKMVKVEAIKSKCSLKYTLIRQDYLAQEKGKVLLFDQAIVELKNNRWAVRENKRKYNAYTNKIDEQLTSKNNELLTLASNREKALTRLDIEKEREIEQIRQSFDKRIGDIENVANADVDLWAMVQQYTRPILVVFILLSWIAIIYQEIFFKGSGQNVEVKEVSFRPLLLWVLVVGWYDKFYHWFYGKVVNNVGLDKYRYSAIRTNEVSYNALEAVKEKSPNEVRPKIAAVRQIGFSKNSEAQKPNIQNLKADTTMTVATVNIGDDTIGVKTNQGVQYINTNDDRTTVTVDNSLRNCKHCNQPFTFKHWNKRYCSDACRISNWEARTGKTFIKGKK
jgi:hypothetical protein